MIKEATMINIAICDDDKNIIAELRKILTEYAVALNTKVDVYAFLNGQALVDYLSENHIDILYLDIQMDNLTGIEVGYKIRKELSNDDIQIVYISAIKDYAMELFKIRPNNFLIKPFSKEEVYETLKEALRLLDNKAKTFTFNVKGKDIKKKITDIIYFESSRHKVKIVTNDGKFEFYSTIADVYKELENFGFAICHSSYIVNIEHIVEFNKDKVKMSNDVVIKISRGKSKDFFEQVAKYDMIHM